MKRLIIFASMKGGVGKSFAARTFLDLARTAGRTVSAWDLDGATGSLALLYATDAADPLMGVGLEDVRDPRAPGQWIDAMHGPADDVLLNVPGGALDNLLHVLDGGAKALTDEAKTAGREVVLVSVIGMKRDSSTSPLKAIDMFGDSVHHVVVKNGWFGERTDFVIFDGVVDSETKAVKYGKSAVAITGVGGQVLYLPKLNPVTDSIMDDAMLTFPAAAEAHQRIGRRHAANVRGWLAEAAREFAGSWLDPGAELKVAAPIAAQTTKVARQPAAVA